ncbi:MAG: hypothetical protein Q9192_003729 [Flavoplaca navasiana]
MAWIGFEYNSVLFLTIQANTYSAVLADHTFLNTGVYNTTNLDKIRLQKYCDPLKEQSRGLPDPCGSKIPSQNPYQPAQIVEKALWMLHMFQETGDVEELTPLACLQAYKNQYVSARGDVLVIQSETVLPPLVYANKYFYNTADDYGYTEFGVPPEDEHQYTPGFFFVKINVLDRNRPGGERTIRPESAILTCGFSPGAILLAIILGVLILLGALILSFRRYDSDMPIASTSSAVISAACHPLENDPDAALLPVQWGVASKTRGIRHCCFSSKLVVPPTPGYVYK